MDWQRLGGWITGTLARLRNTPEPAAAMLNPPAEPAAESVERQQKTLGSMILAQLLLELPEHHRDCSAAWQANDLEQLGRCIHKLSGAVAYCDLPDLSASLAGLRQALQSTNDRKHLRKAFAAASRSMTALMETTGTGPA
jgi:HPt (histidine-containing phosphotransfer) domain-containing protein